MNNFLLWLTIFAKSLNYYELFKWTIILFSVLSVLSVTITALVYGYPKIKAWLIVFWVLAGIALYYLAQLGFKNGGTYFESSRHLVRAVLLTFGVIIGLYAAFFVFVLLICIARWHTKEEVTATLCPSIAEIEEFPLDKNNLPVLKLKTDKLCIKKPRLDDRVNYFKLEEYIKELKQKPVPPVTLAEIEFCERVVKHLKNTILTDVTRYELNEALSSLIKIGAKCGV